MSCIYKSKDYQEVIAELIKDNDTEWSDDHPVLHLDVKTVMTQEEDDEDEDETRFAKAELLEHLKISGPLRVLVTDLRAKRLGGGNDPFDLATEVSTAFPLHMIARRTSFSSSSSLSTLFEEEEEEQQGCPPNDHHHAVDDDTRLYPSSSAFDNEDPLQKKIRRRHRRQRRMMAGALGCGVVGGFFLGPAGCVAAAASGAFALRTVSKIGERRKDFRTARIAARRRVAEIVSREQYSSSDTRRLLRSGRVY
jgi:hypothetical protein